MAWMEILRRLSSVGCSSVPRRSCSSAAGRVSNREVELSSLNKLLRPSAYFQPGKLIAVLGPKDSGKTALIREFRRRQKAGEVSGVSSYIDMREKPSQNFDEFARTLWRTLGASLDEKVKAGVASRVFEEEKLDADASSFKVETPIETWSDVQHERPLVMVFRALEDYSLKLTRLGLSNYVDGFPTIFIDEANVLREWQPDAWTELLRHLVRISKQECFANVVLLSSSNLFKSWLERSEAIRGHQLLTKTIGNFPKEDAWGFVKLRINPERVKEVEEIWDDVFEQIGGAPLRLWDFTSVVHQSELGHAGQAWEEWRDYWIYSSLASLKARAQNPGWTLQQFHQVVKLIVKKPDGVLPYSEASSANLAAAVDSMIQDDLLHWRTYSGWDFDLTGVKAEDYPIVMPSDRPQFMAMKMLVR